MSRAGRPVGDTFWINERHFAADVENLALLSTWTVRELIGQLRWLADQYESDAALADEALKAKQQVVDLEAEGLEARVARLERHMGDGHPQPLRFVIEAADGSPLGELCLECKDSADQGAERSLHFSGGTERCVQWRQAEGPRVDAPESGAA